MYGVDMHVVMVRSFHDDIFYFFQLLTVFWLAAASWIKKSHPGRKLQFFDRCCKLPTEFRQIEEIIGA